MVMMDMSHWNQKTPQCIKSFHFLSNLAIFQKFPQVIIMIVVSLDCFLTTLEMKGARVQRLHTQDKSYTVPLLRNCISQNEASRRNVDAWLIPTQASPCVTFDNKYLLKADVGSERTEEAKEGTRKEVSISDTGRHFSPLHSLMAWWKQRDQGRRNWLPPYSGSCWFLQVPLGLWWSVDPTNLLSCESSSQVLSWVQLCRTWAF